MTDPNAVNGGVPNEENAGASGQSEGYDAQSSQPFGGSPYSQAPQQPPQQPYAQPTQFEAQQQSQPYYGQPSSAAGYTPYGQSAQPQGQPPQQPYAQPAQSSSSPYGQPAQATQSSSAPYGQPTQPGPQQPYAQPQPGPTPPYGQQPQSGPVPPYGGGNSANYSYANNGVPLSPTPAGMPTGEPPLWAPYYGISFVGAVKRFFQKYATFTGRASRSEYWWVYLFSLIVTVAFSILSAATDDSSVISALEGLWGLAIIVPNFALSIRRLHDQNKSGWWLLLPYGLYLLGAIIWLIGGVSAVAGFGADPSGVSVGTGVGLGMMVLGIIPLLAGFVLSIVLFVGASKPEGSRYDVPSNAHDHI